MSACFQQASAPTFLRKKSDAYSAQHARQFTQSDEGCRALLLITRSEA